MKNESQYFNYMKHYVEEKYFIIHGFTTDTLMQARIKITPDQVPSLIADLVQYLLENIMNRLYTRA